MKPPTWWPIWCLSSYTIFLTHAVLIQRYHLWGNSPWLAAHEKLCIGRDFVRSLVCRFVVNSTLCVKLAACTLARGKFRQSPSLTQTWLRGRELCLTSTGKRPSSSKPVPFWYPWEMTSGTAQPKSGMSSFPTIKWVGRMLIGKGLVLRY